MSGPTTLLTHVSSPEAGVVFAKGWLGVGGQEEVSTRSGASPRSSLRENSVLCVRASPKVLSMPVCETSPGFSVFPAEASETWLLRRFSLRGSQPL